VTVILCCVVLCRCQDRFLVQVVQRFSISGLILSRNRAEDLILGNEGDKLRSMKREDIHVMMFIPIFTNIILLSYLLNYLLSPWCRTLFEKLIVSQLVTKS
jgi:hypothetical protein